MIQQSKLSMHVQHVQEGMVPFVQRTRPRVLKIMQDNPDAVDEFKRVSPETTIIGRVYTEDQSVDDPAGAAQKHTNRILRKAMAHKVDAFDGFNEPNQWNHLKQAEFEIHMIENLSRYGIKYAAFSWSVGIPRLTNDDGSPGGPWEDPIVVEACRRAWAVEVHEYGAPTMYDHRQFDPPYTDKEEYLETGFWMLRYRKWMKMLLKNLSPAEMPFIFIGETGIDSGAAHWDPGAQGGWKSFTDAKDFVWGQLGWYDRQIRRDPLVIGATVFQTGTDDYGDDDIRDDHGWESYDLWHPKSARDELEGYLVANLVEEQVEPTDWIDVRASVLRNHQALYPFGNRTTEQITTLAIHHTAVDPSVGVDAIARYHVHTKNWESIVYHLVINALGEIFWCNDLTKITWHAGDANDFSVGICLLGDFRAHKDVTPTSAQINRCKELIVQLRAMLPQQLEVKGHMELMDTECPGDTFMSNWKQLIMGPTPPPAVSEEWVQGVSDIHSIASTLLEG